MDYQATVTGLFRSSLIYLCGQKPLADAKIEMVNSFKSILKQMCSLTDSEFQTEQMSYLGLAFLGVFKHIIYRAQFFSDYKNTIVDYINTLKVTLSKLPLDLVFKQINPLLFDVSDLAGQGASICETDEEGNFEYPVTLELSRESCFSADAVLLDDGLKMLFVVCQSESNVVAKYFRSDIFIFFTIMV